MSRRLHASGFASSAVLVTGFGSKHVTRAAGAGGFDLVPDKPLHAHQILAIPRAATRPT